jgi:outer membrane protein TolC
MSSIRSGFLILTCILWWSILGISQSGKPFDPTTDDISLRLPPLADLIDSALAHDPNVIYRNLQVSFDQYNLQDNQFQFLRNFGLQANIGYGTFDYLYNNTLGGQTPGTYTNTQNLTQYGVGAYVRFPISDLISRHSQVSQAKTLIRQSREMVDVQVKAVRRQVIMQYNEVINKQHLLKIRVKYLETTRINIQTIEKDFANGLLPVSEYARISEIATRAEADVENTKMEFQTAYMLLEELVGTKLNLY